MYFDFTGGTTPDQLATASSTGLTTTQFQFTATNDPNSIPNSGNVNSSKYQLPDRKNLFFKKATTGQSVPFGSGSNVTYQARYTTTFDLLHGGEGWQEGDFFYVWMKDAFYQITVEAISTSNVQANLVLARPTPTPFDVKTTITGDSILGDIREQVLAATDANGNVIFQPSEVTIIGTGLHI